MTQRITTRITTPAVMAAARELGPAMLVRLQSIAATTTDGAAKQFAQEVVDRVFAMAEHGFTPMTVINTDPAPEPEWPTIR